MNDEIRKLISECLNNELVDDINQITDDEELLIVGIDSINLVVLILEIEKKYNIKFDINDIDIECFSTINNIVRTISEYLSKL